MFRLAKCNDLISLKVKHKARWSKESDMGLIKIKDKKFVYSEVFQWNIKEMGTLLCTDQILEHGCRHILEVGAGYNLYFDRNFGKSHDYWMMDTEDYYPDKVFKKAMRKRKHTRFIDNLMGEYDPRVPNGSADMVFSVSVLEHVPDEKLVDCYRDMFRILKPGGIISHSIDVTYSETDILPDKHLQAIKKAGFEIDGEIGWEWALGGNTEEATLTQPLSNLYGSWRQDWSKVFCREYPISTILCIGTKP